MLCWTQTEWKRQRFSFHGEPHPGITSSFNNEHLWRSENLRWLQNRKVQLDLSNFEQFILHLTKNIRQFILFVNQVKKILSSLSISTDFHRCPATRLCLRFYLWTGLWYYFIGEEPVNPARENNIHCHQIEAKSARQKERRMNVTTGKSQGRFQCKKPAELSILLP